MPRIVRSDESEVDVYEIARFIAEENPAAAFDLIDTIDDVLRTIASSPGMGQARDDLAPAIRMFPVGKYLIFYREIPDGIELVRVLHGARNLRRLFRRKLHSS